MHDAREKWLILLKGMNNDKLPKYVIHYKSEDTEMHT
jgi:hypothetical protein